MILIVTACASRDQAERIAEALVKERLAACVQIWPVTSVYRWDGEVEWTEEHVLHIKTGDSLAGRVEARVGELHSYELPELIIVPVSGGSAAYRGWVERETQAV